MARQLTFQQWLAANPDLDDGEPCEQCQGEGMVDGEECVCDKCGHEHDTPEVECPECKGTGGGGGSARRLYRERLAADRDRLKLMRSGRLP